MAFAATKRKRIQLRRKPIEQLKLTSMIDMFTILLVYLLKSYSPTEMYNEEQKLLELPYSVSTKEPLETTLLQISQNMITLNGKPIIMVDADQEYQLCIPEMDKSGHLAYTESRVTIVDNLGKKKNIKRKQYRCAQVISPAINKLPKLFNKLDSDRENYEKLAAKVGRTFKGEITIMCDKGIPYSVLKRVMYTAGQSGFGNFKFAAMRRDY